MAQDDERHDVVDRSRDDGGTCRAACAAANPNPGGFRNRASTGRVGRRVPVRSAPVMQSPAREAKRTHANAEGPPARGAPRARRCRAMRIIKTNERPYETLHTGRARPRRTRDPDETPERRTKKTAATALRRTRDSVCRGLAPPPVARTRGPPGQRAPHTAHPHPARYKRALYYPRAATRSRDHNQNTIPRLSEHHFEG